MARGLHYSGLTDAMWSPSGHSLVVCSSDGYLSFLTFDEGELGRVYETKTDNGTVIDESKEVVIEIPATVTEATPLTSSSRLVSPLSKENRTEQSENILTPDPKQVNILQPKKKSVVQAAEKPTVDQRVESPSETKGCEAPKVNILQPKKKRKRAELTLVSSGTQ